MNCSRPTWQALSHRPCFRGLTIHLPWRHSSQSDKMASRSPVHSPEKSNPGQRLFSRYRSLHPCSVRIHFSFPHLLFFACNTSFRNAVRVTLIIDGKEVWVRTCKCGGGETQPWLWISSSVDYSQRHRIEPCADFHHSKSYPAFPFFHQFALVVDQYNGVALERSSYIVSSQPKEIYLIRYLLVSVFASLGRYKVW